MSKLWDWCSQHKGAVVVGILITVISAAVLGAFGIVGVVGKSLYDAPYQMSELRRDLKDAILSTERALASKLDNQSRKLDEQGKQLGRSREDIEKIRKALLSWS